MPKSFSTATIALVALCIAWLSLEITSGALVGTVVGRPEMGERPEGMVGVRLLAGGEIGG